MPISIFPSETAQMESNIITSINNNINTKYSTTTATLTTINGKIDTQTTAINVVDANIDTILARGSVRTIRRGNTTMASYSMTSNVTMSPALSDLTKSLLIFSVALDTGGDPASCQAPEHYTVKGQILNTTTIRFERTEPSGIGHNPIIEYQVVEFY